IAIGTAKLFGIKLMRNFNVPYFSRDIAEFWRRWHISLTTWFRDYVYIPLGGSRVNKAKIVRNTFVIFLVSGFWHGANWTFIAWGAYHALLFLPLILTGKNRKYTNQIAEGRLLPTLKEAGQMLLTFMFAVFGWIIFRAENIVQAWNYLCGIFNFGFFTFEGIPRKTLVFVCVMLIIEWIHRGEAHGLEIKGKHFLIRWSYYLVIIAMIFVYGAFNESFIYFQF
ncbi:MAG: MBOAT family protein, partial [Bacteroidales bacterium]|nr:MBOAT family protein [Bacteroidales bacterium]